MSLLVKHCHKSVKRFSHQSTQVGDVWGLQQQVLGGMEWCTRLRRVEYLSYTLQVAWSDVPALGELNTSPIPFRCEENVSPI
ncbi:hypothetical protein Pmani_017055 [Petrolisthes manimaculis]|uniref:Uncharacterized protein n=1 Tax=Petrolisthes manimaculis TaxID=1843537 RepID=A0AAE1U9U2_9EUCA|nr:hypothetical protein Pmani_017055 [Petrolisthes manimaculis]